MSPSPFKSPFSRRFGMTGFAIIALALMAGGYWYYQQKAKQVIQEEHQVIAAIGALKSEQIQSWRKERRSDALRVAQGPMMRRLTSEFLRNPGSRKIRADLMDLLQLNKMSEAYESVLLLALDGQVLLSTEDSIGPENLATQAAVKAAAASKRPVFSTFFSQAGGITHLDIATAVRDAAGQPLAVMVLRSNADASLFPMIQAWPLPSSSGETVLILRSGDEATVPHKLRFEAQSAPRWHQPLSRTTFPAVQAVLGRQGLFEGIDYRGKQVMADMRAVPGSPWFILNKIDEDEALAQLHFDALLIGLIAGAVVLLAGALTAYFHRHRQAEGFRALYESEQLKLATEKVLLAANQKLALLFEQTPLGIIEWDLAFRVTRWNPAAERIFGYSAAEAIGQQVAFIVPESARALMAPIMQALTTGQGGERSTHENVRKDGTIIQCEWYNSSLTDTEGHVVAVASQVEDITRRKRAEQDLIESHERFELASRATFNVLWDRDFKTNAVWRNDNFQTLFGYSKEEAEANAEFSIKLVHPDDMAGVEAGIQMAIDAGSEFWTGQYRFRRQDGSYALVEDRAIIVRDAEGHVTRLLGAMQDVSARKQAEEALRLSEARNRAVTHSAHDAIITADSQGHIVGWNRGAEAIFGYAESEAVGKSITVMIPERYLGRHLEGIGQLRSGGEPHVTGKTVELAGMRKDGSEFPLELSLAKWESPEGWFVTSIIRDISRRKRREEEQKRLDQVLQETNIELGVAKKANLAKSDFLSAMSHELRTPLIGITGMLEVLTQSDLDAEQRQVVSIIHESSESLLHIIGDILDFSKIEANKMELAHQTFSARALLESMSQVFKPAAFAKGLDLIVEVDPRIAPAHVADAMRLRQILNNFMSNAVKFTERGSITLRLRLVESTGHSESLAFEVEDTGIGVSPENISKLFEPFSQAEASTTRRFGGTGLGLTISRRLAELMGGSLTMQSTLRHGSTITLMVDLATGDEQDIVNQDLPGTAQPAPMRPAPSIEVAERERGLILLAEDHPTNRIVLTQQVNRAGFALEVAVDGEEAFDKWRSGRYSLLLTDLHMPRMDGYQLTKAVRQWERENGSERTPILALTANALGGEAERCLELGMDDFLVKPVTIPLLASKLRQWMPHVKIGEAAETTSTGSLPPKDAQRRPVLDPKTLLDLCDGEAKAAQEILDDFILTTKTDLQVMQEGLEQKDMSLIVRQSHRIKGSAAMVGACDVAQRSRELEAYAKLETAEWETVTEQITGIQDALQAIGPVWGIASPDQK